MLNETNSFGRLVWTISGKMSSFLANETTVMFLFSEVSVRLFVFSGRSVRMLLEMTFLFGWTSAFFVIFALDFELVLHWYQSHTSFCGGLPVIARIALLDTRFKEYQHALVGTILTTLHAGNVLLTFYPNFNLSLEDPNLPTTLKVQIQLQGAEQTPTSKIATLHHQIMYRLQNHALDLPTPYTTSDALMILADTNTIPTIIQIPKQIQKQDLLQLMPLEWLTNYEHFHQNSKLVQTTEAIFDRRPNGQVKLSFQTPDSKPISDSPQLSYTAMITAAQTGQEKKLPIHGFSSEGYPVYPDKINGHFLWDVPEAHMCNPDCPCLDDTDIDEELEVMRRKTKKKKKASYPASSSTGQPEEPKQHEAVLNWQTKNANAQNHTLHQLDKKIDHVATQVSQTETKVDSINSRLEQMYIHLQDQIFELDADLRRMINNHIWGPEFNKKEAKIRKLKAELSRIDAEKTRPSLFTQPQPTPVSPPIFDTYASFYTTSRPQQHVYNQFFGFSHLQPTPQPSSPKKSRSKVKISEPRPKATSSSSTSTIPLEESQQDIPKPLKKDKSPMDQFHYHTVQTESSDSSDSSEPETNNSSSSSSYDTSQASIDSESEYADITSILMATETTDPSASTSTPIVDDNPSDQASQTNPVPPPVHDHSTKPSSISWFTFDDIPRHKWAARLQEFAAWIDLQGTKPNAQPQAVLREFMARSIDRKEYHQMKCCSLKRHLLDAHYKRMSILFYKLNGFNEPSLKHVFIASLPPELQPDLQRKLTVTNLSIADISLGKIFQMAMLSLDKICEQKEFFKDLMGDKKPFSEACKKPHLKMECKDEKKPSLKMSILPSKFHKPIPVIGFLDTGADTSMIDPSVLPSDCWEHHSKLFRAVNGEIFKTTLITKKPIVAIHTSQLSHMLKKQCPPWGPAQTEAVKQLKTDASNDYWSAILLEAINGLRHFCAHASGQFKDSIYKEILAVKYGIKKFEFHLISHKFLINMDNSSFPRIFDFKNKLPLDKQLLSLKTWFAKYDFTVQHIKGNQNLIPDFLTRPALISSIQTIPVIAMNRQLPFKALNQRNFPMNISFQLPYQLQDFVKKFLYRFFFNVQTKKPNRFPNLCMEHLFLIGLTLSSLSISEDELWYMWCLTTLYATKLVFPIKPVLTHLTTPEFSPDLLWTLFEWYSPLTWWRQQLHHLYTFHGLDKMPKQEANMWTIAFIVHRPYFQHPETRDYWTQDMAYEGKTYPHPYTFIHDTVVTSVLKAYLMELNNVPPPATNIHHTSIGPSHTLEIIPKTQGCTPDSPAASTPQHMSEANEEKYQQTEAYLDQRQRRQHKRQYETETGDVSPSRYPSTP
ncbi:hypothetical protein KPL70_007559 [Citrus sinensis]|nr:hypothetical protein KPL70_007559 [Citrus sinensis]